MFTTDAIGKSEKATVKAAAAILALLFIVVLGSGLLNIGTGQALAYDDRDDQGDYERHHKPGACAQTSQAALTACRNSAGSDYWLGIGNCDNLSDRQDKQACLEEVRSSLNEDYATCNDQYKARQEVCRELGGGPYDPDLDPENFTADPGLNENPYFPLTSSSGKTFTYYSYSKCPDNTPCTPEILQTIVVEVGGTREIDGFPCRVVTDKVYEGDIKVSGDHNPLEDTIDWYSQDSEGNVWYFGETTIAYSYEYGPPIASTEGSWVAGVDEAKPGFIMLADPGTQKSKLYRQEFALGTAEDLGQVIEMVDDLPALPPGVSLPAEVHGPYLHTQDSTPLEPDLIEDKYYAPGVGLVLTDEPEATEVLIKIE